MSLLLTDLCPHIGPRSGMPCVRLVGDHGWCMNVFEVWPNPVQSYHDHAKLVADHAELANDNDALNSEIEDLRSDVHNLVQERTVLLDTLRRAGIQPPDAPGFTR